MNLCQSVLVVDESGSWSKSIIGLQDAVLAELDLFGLCHFLAFLDHNLFFLHVGIALISLLIKTVIESV